MSNLLRSIPSLSELLDSPPLKSLIQRASHNVVVATARKYLDDLRTQVKTAAASVQIPQPAELAQRIAAWLDLDGPATLAPVINATGVIIDDQLGRAPLAEEALESAVAAGRNYVNLELNLATGEPLARVAAVESLLTSLSGAEAALVVNNDTAALLAALTALARSREVVVARSEVGDVSGCRLTDIAAASGAILREVGAANRTRGDDYAAAFSPLTAAVLHLQRSDYEIVGAAEETPLAELVTLAHRRSLPVIDNVASGALLDFSKYGLGISAQVLESVRAGADLVLASGDKLLGGPQCGILLGRRALLDQIASQPLYRALRLDKLRLAALAATLRLSKDVELAERSLPVVSLLSTPVANLKQRAERMAPQITATRIADAYVVESQSRVLRSRLASQTLPTICLSLAPRGCTADQLHARLRSSVTPVLGRIEAGRLLLDLRSVPPRDDLALVAAIEALRPVSQPEAQPGSLPSPDSSAPEHLAD